jgi:alkaline phosphatase
MPLKPFKFALIADIHYGSDKQEDGRVKRLASRALSLSKYLVTRMNNEIRPAFLVQLGNLIEDEDAETDEDNYATMLEALKPLTMPIYHVIGDCEQVNLDLQQIRTTLKYPNLYYSFDAGEFHFVVLFALSRATGGFVIDDAQRKWLATDLDTATKPTIIFTHRALDEPDLAEGPPIEQPPDDSSISDRAGILRILAASNKVIAVFNGNADKNSLQEFAGINYIGLQSLVENISPKGKTCSESFAVVTLDDAEIRVEIPGMDPAEYRISRVRKK